MINRFNRWYDTVKEPQRFLIFIIPMTVIIVLINIKATSLIGILGLCLMGLLAASRAVRHKGHVLIGVALGTVFAMVLVLVLALFVVG